MRSSHTQSHQPRAAPEAAPPASLQEKDPTEAWIAWILAWILGKAGHGLVDRREGGELLTQLMEAPEVHAEGSQVLQPSCQCWATPRGKPAAPSNGFMSPIFAHLRAQGVS